MSSERGGCGCYDAPGHCESICEAREGEWIDGAALYQCYLHVGCNSSLEAVCRLLLISSVSIALCVYFICVLCMGINNALHHRKKIKDKDGGGGEEKRRTEQNRTEKNRIEQNRIEQKRKEKKRAEQGSPSESARVACPPGRKPFQSCPFASEPGFAAAGQAALHSNVVAIGRD